MIRLDLPVAEVMSHKVVTCTPEATVRDVVHKMVEHHCFALPVVDESGHVLGLISEIDLAKATSRFKPVKDLMNTDCQVVTAHTTLGEVLRIIAETQQRAVPVVTPGKRIEGIVTTADLLNLCYKEFA